MAANKTPIDQFIGRYEFLSNFYRSELFHNGHFYPTSEHAFQAAKTLNQKVRWRIAHAYSPGMAKRLGRSVQLRPGWDDIKVSVMREILVAKFTVPDLKEKLLKTGDRVLIEGNGHGDRFWGACVHGQGKIKIWDGKNHVWYGENKLGELLMELREYLNV